MAQEPDALSNKCRPLVETWFWRGLASSVVQLFNRQDLGATGATNDVHRHTLNTS